MDNVWSKDRNIGKYMYLVGKYKNKRNNFKLGSTVNKMKKTFYIFTKCVQTDQHALEPVSWLYKFEQD